MFDAGFVSSVKPHVRTNAWWFHWKCHNLISYDSWHVYRHRLHILPIRRLSTEIHKTDFIHLPYTTIYIKNRMIPYIPSPCFTRAVIGPIVTFSWDMSEKLLGRSGAVTNNSMQPRFGGQVTRKFKPHQWELTDKKKDWTHKKCVFTHRLGQLGIYHKVITDQMIC